MKKTIFMLFAAGALFASCDNNNNASTAKLENNNDSVSYAIGANIGSNILRQMEQNGDTALNHAAIIQGFVQGINSEDLSITEEMGTTLINDYMTEKDAERREAEMAAFAANIEISEAFFAENAEKEGVIETPSGLQYEVITKGTGQLPIDGDKVRVNYEGSLLDGQVFDSSYDKGQPLEIGINRVIPGWTEGLKLMPVGSTYIFYIPSDLAYGENPPPNTIIQPYSTLVFKVELLDIVK
jgi:FKBP-type peptidyl-prolyl cis-trans isomerase